MSPWIISSQRPLGRSADYQFKGTARPIIGRIYDSSPRSVKFSVLTKVLAVIYNMEMVADWTVGIFGVLSGIFYGWQRLGIPRANNPRPPLQFSLNVVTSYYKWLPRGSANLLISTILLMGASCFYHEGDNSLTVFDFFQRIVILVLGVCLGYGVGIQFESK